MTAAKPTPEQDSEGDRMAELRAKFPQYKFSYAPDPACCYCKGIGTRPPRTLPSGNKIGETLCACVYLGPNTAELMPLIAASAKKALAELSEPTFRQEVLGAPTWLPSAGDHCQYEIRPGHWIACVILEVQPEPHYGTRYLARYIGHNGVLRTGVVHGFNLRQEA